MIATIDLRAHLVELLRDEEVRAELRSIIGEPARSVERLPPAPFATTARYARRLKVSERTVRDWIKAGMPAVRMGSVVRVRVAEGDAWLIAGGTKREKILRLVRHTQIAAAKRGVARASVY